MARGVLTVQNTSRTGLNASYTAATVDGHAFDNTAQKAVLHVKNGGGVETVITIATAITVDGLAVPDKTITIPAAGERFIGPFADNIYNNNDLEGDTGLEKAVFINAAPQASVTYAAIKPGTL